VNAVPAAMRLRKADAEAESSAKAGFTYGVDLSVAPSLDSLKCFRDPHFTGKSRTVPAVSSANNGPNYTPAKINMIKTTAFTKLGLRQPMISGNLATTVKNAQTAGFAPSDIGVYFIDFRAKLGAAAGVKLIDGVAAALSPVKSLIGELWLDVEGSLGGTSWSASTTTNCAYITAIVKHIKANPTQFPWKLGIYSGMYTWGTLVGSKCDFSTFRDLPFWYAAYGPTFDSFASFKRMPNAWSSAKVHQWHGTTNFCGASVDFNIYQ